MAKILSIETSTNVCSVAIHDSGNLMACQELFIDRSHSTYLHHCIENLLKITEVPFSELNAVAISKGPGSYTGLRIGTSTAKGICYAHDLPLIAINTLEAMAKGVTPYILENALLCPMIDARRKEVYCLVTDLNGKSIVPTEAKIMDNDAFSNLLSEHIIYFFGNGAPKNKPILGHNQNARFIDGVTTSAVGVGILAWINYEHQRFEDVAYFEPYYLKDFAVRKPTK
jgi:tRNA threonylcarbamoyladenosine biosynthesis protein TsaB